MSGYLLHLRRPRVLAGNGVRQIRPQQPEQRQAAVV